MKRATSGPLALAFFFSAASAACGTDAESVAQSYCGHLRDCAEKAGDEFSETECKDELIEATEEAETAGCAEEWDAVLDCVSDLELQCSDEADDVIEAECGAKLEAHEDCEDGREGTGVAIGGNRCDAAANRVVTKLEECGVEVAESDEEAGGAECTAEIAEQYDQIADCYEAAPCEEVHGAGDNSALQECISAAS
jgi:hypothetical protein